ncbi:hypothetical protein [Stieleria varia]|nr:hypothetical protein [Stieleria varia]
MPSVYQLLPRPQDGRVVDTVTGESLDFYDVRTWMERGWGLANRGDASDLEELLPATANEEQRYWVAVDHLRNCLAQAKAFHQALDSPAESPAGTSLHLIVGTSLKTPSVLASDVGNNVVRRQSEEPGDNTTTVRSALGPMQYGNPIISWTTIGEVSANHRKLTSDPDFTTRMLELLMEPRRTTSEDVHFP